MLFFMRKHAKFFYVFFVLIIISFIFFYVGPMDNKDATPFITVGERKIFISDYWRFYDNLRNMYRQAYKDQYNDELEKTLKLKDKAIELLVANELLLMAAENLGVTVDENELNEAIVNDPNFKRDGVFNTQIYERILTLNRLTTTYFEAKRLDELKIDKVRRIIGLSTDVLNSQLPINEMGDKALLDNLRQTIAAGVREKAVLSYINTLKKSVSIKIRYQMVS